MAILGDIAVAVVNRAQERQRQEDVFELMTHAPDRSSEAAKGLGGAAASSSETPVSSAENPSPEADPSGNTPATRPHPSGANALAGDNPPMTTVDSKVRLPHERAVTDHAGERGSDYANASGRDHPAESEHDHARQKLDGESTRMAEDLRPKR